MSFVLSQEQELFVEKALEGNNILVDACIGSGKTTSIQYLCQRFPKSKSILYLTYNKLLKIDAQSKIKGENITVTNYHGFASIMLRKAGVACAVSDLIQTFNHRQPDFPFYDILVIDEYQDIDLELSKLLEIVKSSNPAMQIIAVGDMEQKIYDKTTLNAFAFIARFLEKYIRLDFTQCFRLNSTHAAMLGRIWNKSIVGVNESCYIKEMTVSQAVQFIATKQPEDILCLGARTGTMSFVLNVLETKHPEIFNKRSVYASISDNDDIAVAPKPDSAIFTTYDSSKGLERKYCIIFDFDESYWEKRVNSPQQSYAILRNIFCVAASRGKEQIIFVRDDKEPLSEKSLSTPVDSNGALNQVGFSEMFDFKYKESIEKCYSLLSISKLPVADNEVIAIKAYDNMIDLSPCIGIYQEASFFEKYDIDKEIELHKKLHRNKAYLDAVPLASIDKKILYLTTLETSQWRYYNQVDTPFVSDEEKLLLHKRLSVFFQKNDNSQVKCDKEFDYMQKTFTATGYADVVKNDIVYELKFVSELKHEHFLQCACYVIALNLKKGVLWNTRQNEMYEIKIPDEKQFCLEVAKTVLKVSPDNSEKAIKNAITKESQSPNDFLANDSFDKEKITNPKEYFAVIDTETTWSNRVMSIGICIIKKDSYECIEQKYYIIMPEATEQGMYSKALKISESPVPFEGSRKEVLEKIKELIDSYSITDIFAYNASFDKSHLPEMHYVSWYDIMKIAAYKQFNPHIPDNLECFNNGRLKKNYGVEPIFRLLSGNTDYFESHNAVRDAYDEAKIMKMLNIPYQVYIQKAEVKNNPIKQNTPNKAINVFDPHGSKYTSSKTLTQRNDTLPKDKNDYGLQNSNSDTIFSDEAAVLLGVSKSTIYHLIKSGDLSAQKIKNKYHISKESVLSYLEWKKRNKRNALIVGALGILLFLIIWFLSLH